MARNENEGWWRNLQDMLVAAIITLVLFAVIGGLAGAVVAIVAGSLGSLLYHILVHGDAKDLRQLRRQHKKRIGK